MRELSLHILDIVQNSIRAKAREIIIDLEISSINDTLSITITDDGDGMTSEMAKNALDPFVTSRTTRKVGLGLPLFKAAAEQCGGGLSIESVAGKGTTVRAVFGFKHIDRAPLGDIILTVQTLLQGNPEIDFLYRHKYDEKIYEFSTKILRRELEDVPLNHPLVLEYIAKDMHEGLEDLLVEV